MVAIIFVKNVRLRNGGYFKIEPPKRRGAICDQTVSLNLKFLTKIIATIEFLVKFWVKWAKLSRRSDCLFKLLDYVDYNNDDDDVDDDDSDDVDGDGDDDDENDDDFDDDDDNDCDEFYE